jgi:oligopeptide/dipeptide ABC transporter ATP-binding protein
MEAALIEVENLQKHYGTSGGLLAGLRGRSAPKVRAVNGISFTLRRGETVGLLGESGCGKTTTGRLLLKLTEPTEGQIRYDGRRLDEIRGRDLQTFRRRAQLIFQNPFDALNPRFTIWRSLTEPLVNARVPRAEYGEYVERALDLARFSQGRRILQRFPHQLSGGQLQRIVIARALILQPEFVVADEPVSMLDVSVRAGILNLLRDVSRELSLTAVYISHDLSLVRYLCPRTIVMYLGSIVEDGPTEEIIRSPKHPYTRALVGAVPTPDPDQPRGPLPIGNRPPDARIASSGCSFSDRCPAVMPRCRTIAPAARPVGLYHQVVCHLYEGERGSESADAKS